MNKTQKWRAIGAASVLGIGIVAGGGLMAANAMTINDVQGADTGVGSVSVQSTSDAPITADTTISTATPSAVAALIVVSVASPTAPASPASAVSAASAASVASAASAPSAVSAASAGSAD